MQARPILFLVRLIWVAPLIWGVQSADVTIIGKAGDDKLGFTVGGVRDNPGR